MISLAQALEAFCSHKLYWSCHDNCQVIIKLYYYIAEKMFNWTSWILIFLLCIDWLAEMY